MDNTIECKPNQIIIDFFTVYTSTYGVNNDTRWIMIQSRAVQWKVGGTVDVFGGFSQSPREVEFCKQPCIFNSPRCSFEKLFKFLNVTICNIFI